MTTKQSAPLWQAATSFATWKHCHQLRKDGRTPYSAHPARVALTIACVFGVTDETIIAAALLHDTLEDTTTDFDNLEELFGREVATIVAYVSKDMRLPEEEREIAYDRQLAHGPWQARLIKLGDVYDNLSESSPESRPKILTRVHRALKLAEHDPQLEHACEAVRALVKRMTGSNGKLRKNGQGAKGRKASESRRMARV